MNLNSRDMNVYVYVLFDPLQYHLFPKISTCGCVCNPIGYILELR